MHPENLRIALIKGLSGSLFRVKIKKIDSRVKGYLYKLSKNDKIITILNLGTDRMENKFIKKNHLVANQRRWEKTLRSVENSPLHENRLIFRCKPIPEDLCEKTNLGWPRGADEQYRCLKNIHVLWFRNGNWCLVHRDSVDPRKDPIGHLMCDVLNDPFNSCRSRRR